ncbi:hypothetical protein A3C20_03335 [Candidatus Kaiserbacteria bacterium RIFCSPHIGHO2_02_FULL_55_25]|uniref:Uncharacterized protein n=1 Tax=Candidatus Kaiserbacteria bacterium RIFCSPHIGHO2_02_FULL_55_25 TaxID=1798498 RepID=A0A1F6E618_9BACT|nr:MAG: hypothetical protein A2764_02460 [Candidatus Kaiserbacteria bacterium RIFCSPHIGHO2_01_FULL_55_79]OGG69143.1 MAG: hypothetical protein A3C20_03335 [Candidatus Kaiserbacteria bacterium RIFCSPHIGHO2_02_FULL_55_25]OGG77701.1 MAG: hypothetical protein A3F56_00405 [Candidatus Kaiserbacteria bacterium RIFCSPHIGHO2_12_FULL_55_13]OGG83354.1 MAG: hypothetical protein A3A42_04000 [Candidatus Kaiserbacteria bacterium RIFCSPLOWO2_01_FULL_55_25]
MRYLALAFLPALLPEVVFAQTLSVVTGVFNILVGLMLVAAFLMFFGALIGWFVRRGAWPSYRDEMIHIMEWAVVVMFVLVVLLMLVHFVQVYKAAAAFVFGIIIFLAIVWVIMTVATAKPKKDADEH